MRKLGLTLTALLLAGPALRAQAQSAAPPAVPLDTVLRNWETAMKGINSLKATVNRTTLEKTFQSTEVFEGQAYYQRPNLAFLQLVKKGKRDVFEQYVFSGTFLYMYAPKEKAIRVYEMPQNKQGKLEDNFLSFMFNMNAEDAKKRYEMTILPPPPNDKWYLYVLIKPRNEADKRDFTRARLVLNGTTYLPRQLWFEQPSGNEITWDFPSVTTGVQINRTMFATPQLPNGWKFERVRQDAPPRVIRPNRQ